MATQPVSPYEQFTRGGLILSDTPCVRCQYNLRGLPTEGHCPECGTPIAQSVHGKLLRFADPAWLRRVRLGLSLKLWNILLVLLLTIAAIVFSRLIRSQATGVILNLSASALGLAAVFLITSPEPNLSDMEDTVGLRTFLRLMVIAAFAGQVCSNVQPLIAGTWGPVAAWVLFILGVALGLAGIPQVFGEFVYLRRFARRVPHPKLEKSTTTVMWGLGISYLFVGGSGVLMAIYAWQAGATAATTTTVTQTTAGAAPPASPIPGMGLMISGLAVCMGTVAVVVFAIWYFSLLRSYYVAFKRAEAGT